MLSYAFHDLKWEKTESLGKEAFENIHNLFACILSKGISSLLKQGLYREYIPVTENLETVRGKIEMNGSIQNMMKRKRVLSCEYDELSENNILNQILKTTSMLLLRHPFVDEEYISQLKKEMMFFSKVDSINPSLIRFDILHFQRNNISYRLLIIICQLIIEGMLLNEEEGCYKLAEFLDDRMMSVLYEKFILEYYRKEYPILHASSSQIPWALDDDNTELLPTMQSDVMLSKDNDILIIDAKYYGNNLQSFYGKSTIHSNNLYQIFSYVKNKEMELREKEHTVSGMLLYAKTNAMIQPNVSYSMSGNKVSVITLDLNLDFQDVKAQLNQIAKEYFLV